MSLHSPAGLQTKEASATTMARFHAEEFRKRVRQQVGAQADGILKLYPASTEAEGAESQKLLARDMSMVSMYRVGRETREDRQDECVHIPVCASTTRSN